MNRFILVLLVGVIFLAGCTITQFSKRVVIEKDGDGKVIKTTITEELIQPNRSEPPKDAKLLDME